MQWRRKLQLQNRRISTPKRQKDDFEALFKRKFKRKIISAKIEKICWQITFAALMQPFQYDLRSSAAKDNSITHAAAAPSNLDAATTMRFCRDLSCKTAPIYGRGNGVGNCSSNEPAILDAKADKKTIQEPHFLTRNFTDRNHLLAPTHWRNNSAAQFDFRSLACSRIHTRYDFIDRLQPLYTERHIGITHAAASSPKHSRCNLDAATTMRFAASRSKPAPIYGRGNIKWRQWSSHSNAICN